MALRPGELATYEKLSHVAAQGSAPCFKRHVQRVFMQLGARFRGELRQLLVLTAEGDFQLFANRSRQGWALPAARYRHRQIAAPQNGRQNKIAVGRIVRRIDPDTAAFAFLDRESTR